MNRSPAVLAPAAAVLPQGAFTVKRLTPASSKSSGTLSALRRA